MADPVSSGVSWVDGQLVELGEPSLRADDHGFVVGDGVFETTKVVNGTAFALTRHLRRLARSALGLGLEEPSEGQIRLAVDQVLAADPTAGLLRITWSSGPGPLGSPRGAGPGTLIVATSAANTWPTSEFVFLVDWRRNEHGALSGLKTTSYAENVLALATAQQAGCTEALFLNTEGMLCEGSGTNVFLVIDGVPTTPPLSSGCLAGITRELVLEALGEDAQVRDLKPEELRTADEAFLTSATRDISPIAAISGAKEVLFDHTPGLVTNQVMATLAQLEEASFDP